MSAKVPGCDREGLLAERSRCLAGGGVEEEGRFGGLAGPIVSVSASESGVRRFARLETD